MESLPAANVLPFVERYFAFLVTDYGFELAQSTEIPSMAWFKRDDLVVVVAYDFLRDAVIEVDLLDRTVDERYALADVLAFEPHVAPLRMEGTRERALVVSELERLATVLATYGREFLAGDVAGFRRRFREALLVRGTRASAMREFYAGDLVRARALFESMHAYWDDRDREHVELLGAGKQLRFLRRGG
ncbi:MAG: hypothetical protein NVS1B2_06890 [Vulcanimicrobiaceae bacterium]